MLRVWSEHLSLERAQQPQVLDLVERGGLHPLFAVRPETDIVQLAALGRNLRERGLEFGIWPLLSEAEGYWPSVRNAGRFASRVHSIVDELDELGVGPDWVAVDLEPPLDEGGWMRAAARALRRALSEGAAAERYREASETYRELAKGLAAREIGSLAVTTPTSVADLSVESSVWQRALEVPWEGIPWTRAGVMSYGSMMSGYAGGWVDLEDARALQYEFCTSLRQTLGGRAHISLGLTGTGVFGDEPTYRDPAEIACDVAAARAAGIDDIAIFCLEGILAKPAPERWVEAVRDVEPEVPRTTWCADALLCGARLSTHLLGCLLGGDGTP